MTTTAEELYPTWTLAGLYSKARAVLITAPVVLTAAVGITGGALAYKAFGPDHSGLTPEGPKAPQQVIVPAVKDTERVTLKAPAVVLKATVKAKTAIMPGLKLNTAEHLVSTAKVKSSDNPTEVSAVINEDSGEVTTVVTELPKPWFETSSKTELFAEYGVKNAKPAPVLRLGINQELFKIKGLTFGTTAQVDSTGETFAGARLSVRF